MTILSVFRKCFANKYAAFKGRSNRKEYIIFSIIVELFLLLAPILALSVEKKYGTHSDIFIFLAVFFTLISLTLIVPLTSVTIRRPHDINHSGWWILIGVIPYGILLSIILFFYPGTPGANKYGEPPAY